MGGDELKVRYAYVAHCPECGAMCAAVSADDPADFQSWTTLREWLLDGLQVSLRTHEYVKANFTPCLCH